MYKTYHYYLIIVLLSLTSMMSMLINDLFILWFIMEINNFVFLIYMTLTMQNKKMIFLYYLTQIMASFLLIISLMISFIMPHHNFTMMTMFTLSLTLKLGMPPLHLWMPMITMYMPWDMLFIFFTLQKIIPFMFFHNLHSNPPLYMYMILLCMILPPYMIMNTTNLKKIMAYSSINQMGWLLLLIHSTMQLWLLYMIIYTISFYIIKIMFKTTNITPQSWLKSPHSIKLVMFIMMINFAGLPPFSFFMMKWYSIFLFLHMTNLTMLIFIMLISSVIMMYTYIYITIKVSMLYLSHNKFLMMSAPPIKFNHLILFSLLLSTTILII